jgi:predicted kinase
MTIDLREVTLVVVRGLPGSGKSTMTIEYVAAAPQRRARVNRDAMRAMFHGRRLGKRWQEDQVATAEQAMVGALLQGGTSVVIDSTNLRDEHVEYWGCLALAVGCRFEVWDLRDVPLGTCIKRDAMREGPARVGEDVIREMHAEYLAGLRPERTPENLDPVAPTG